MNDTPAFDEEFHDPIPQEKEQPVLAVDLPPGLSDQEVGRRIQRALDYDGCHSFDDINDLLRNKTLHMIRGPWGAWLVQVLNYPLVRVLHVMIVAGAMPGVMDMQEQIFDYARSRGCAHVTAIGRLGWKRTICGPNSKYKWKVHAIHMVHDL